jgi:hypothetical protein
MYYPVFILFPKLDLYNYQINKSSNFDNVKMN